MLGHPALILGVGVLALLTSLLGVCLFRPLALSFDAPGEGAPDPDDLCALSLRHPLFSLRLRVPLPVVAGWVTGSRPIPPISGEIAGIPLPPTVVERLAERLIRRPAAEASPASSRGEPTNSPALLERAKPLVLALGDELDRVRAALRIETLEIDLAYGTGDPASTAVLAGMIWDLASLLPAPCAVAVFPSWTEAGLKVYGQVRMLVFPWQTLVAVLCLRSALKRRGASHGG